MRRGALENPRCDILLTVPLAGETPWDSVVAVYSVVLGALGSLGFVTRLLLRLRLYLWLRLRLRRRRRRLSDRRLARGAR